MARNRIPPSSDLDDQRILLDALKHWQGRLAESPSAMTLCQVQGFTAGDVERRKIGFADGNLPTLSKKERQALHRLGVLNRRSREILAGCVIVPTLTTTGEVESIEALPLNGKPKPATLKFETHAPPTPSTELEDDGTLTVSVAGVSYQLKGMKWETGDLRCTLKATDGKKTHVDRLDMAAARARTAFAKGFEAAGGPPAETIAADLLHVLEEIDRAASVRAVKPQGQAGTPDMTDEQHAEAMSFLKRHDLLSTIRHDLTVAGYVGEDDVKTLAYLVAVSRKLPSCLSLILQSSSGSGKSFLMETVASLCPSEDVLYFSRISPQSLYYMKPGALKHKLVIVDEASGSHEADYSIRTLQTRRKLSLAIPLKDVASGKTETKIFEVEGPISYMESSTKGVHPENASRSFVVSLEETKEQTQFIISSQRAQASKLAGIEDPKVRTILMRHQNAHRLLRTLPVVIPFAGKLKYLPQGNPVRARREHQRFITLIQASALLHQHRRPIKTTDAGVEYIEASHDDEKNAMRLMETLDKRSHDELTSHAATLLRWFEKQTKQKEFTRRELCKALGWTHHKVRIAVAELCREEFLIRLGYEQGQTFKYRLAAV